MDADITLPRPLCFVMMPFGNRENPTGGPPIQFDSVWETAIRPAIEDAGLEPIRGDQESVGGLIHRPIFQRIMMCEYAVADLTTANPNVMYELGIRHAVRPRTTVAIAAAHQPLPFDVQPMRTILYDSGPDEIMDGEEARPLRAMLTERLKQLRADAKKDTGPDSPLFQLLTDWKPAPVARDKTDLFRKQVRIAEEYRNRATDARQTKGKEGIRMLDGIVRDLGSFDVEEAPVLIDVFLAYRDLEAYGKMIELYEKLPPLLSRQVLVREQLAFALNRRSGIKDEAQSRDQEQALELLRGIIDQQGPSAETYGLIGRIHKDRWKAARGAGERSAGGHLRQAIEAYRRGFHADARDTFPGINLVTLLDAEASTNSHAERDHLIPVVRFAVERRIANGGDYWDQATLLELAILEDDREQAELALDDALALLRADWEAKSTAANLGIIAQSRREQDDPGGSDWVESLAQALLDSVKS